MGPIDELYDRGVAYKNDGDYEAAAKEFQAILGMDSQNAAAHRQLGLVYGFMGLFDESIDELQTAVELDGDDVGIRNDLALTYAMLGMVDEAKTHFMFVLLADPENQVAKKNMAYF